MPTKKKETTLKVPSDNWYGTGRRKEAVARVWIFKGSGRFQVNGRDVCDYLPSEMLRQIAASPLDKMGILDKYDVKATVKGGGMAGQADALKLGVARAILETDASLKPELKQYSFLVRDARVKERSKYGKRGARKAPQFRKR
jgi:small subunit ribosomal protein S9